MKTLSSLLCFLSLSAGLFAQADAAKTAATPTLTPVTGEQVVDTINTEFVSHFNLIGEFHSEITGPWTPPEKLATTWQIEIVEYPSIVASQMAIRCHFIADGLSVGDATVVVHCELWREAWFARQPLASGTTFDASTLEAHRVDALRERDALPSNVGDDGFVIAVPISAGRGLTWHDVARRPLVRKGEMVEVTASEGGMSITMKAISLENGSKGDVVNIRNTESQKVIPGVVIADNRVQVQF